MDKDYVVRADKDTHTALSIMAARRKVSIKQVLKELVAKEAAKNPSIEKIIKGLS